MQLYWLPQLENSWVMFHKICQNMSKISKICQNISEIGDGNRWATKAVLLVTSDAKKDALSVARLYCMQLTQQLTRTFSDHLVHHNHIAGASGKKKKVKERRWTLRRGHSDGNVQQQMERIKQYLRTIKMWKLINQSIHVYFRHKSIARPIQ